MDEDDLVATISAVRLAQKVLRAQARTIEVDK
jgi:hypothetical protein